MTLQRAEYVYTVVTVTYESLEKYKTPTKGNTRFISVANPTAINQGLGGDDGNGLADLQRRFEEVEMLRDQLRREREMRQNRRRTRQTNEEDNEHHHVENDDDISM